MFWFLTTNHERVSYCHYDYLVECKYKRDIRWICNGVPPSIKKNEKDRHIDVQKNEVYK